jgi:hypothetical protein
MVKEGRYSSALISLMGRMMDMVWWDIVCLFGVIIIIICMNDLVINI